MEARRPPGLARRAPEGPRPVITDDEHCPGHTHRLPRALLLTLVIICVGLVVSIVLASMLAVQANRQANETDRRLSALEDFITERGEERDDQYKTLDERITAAMCDLLSKLPAGPILDPLRTVYGCGPGLPVESLSPEAQSQLQRYADDAPLTTTDEPFDVGDYFAEPDERFAPPETSYDRSRPRQSPPETTNAPTPSPTVVPPPVATDVPTATPAPVTPAPLIDLNPLTEPVCNLLGVCL